MPAPSSDRPPRTAARALAVALAFALLLTAAACGRSGDDDDAPATTATTAPAAEGDGTTEPAEPAEAADPVTLAARVEATGAVTHGTLTVDGRERAYRLYVPSSLPEGPVPLFVALHGGTGWGDQFAATDRVEGLAEANGFVVVHPDGVKVGDTRGGVWNGGVCCGVAAREGVDDVAFLEALVEEVEAGHDIDPARVFAFGHSNGGIMSYRLACEAAGTFAGIGAVAGTLGVEGCEPAEPVSVIHVHGSGDQNLPITGGAGERSISGVDFPSPTEGFATLAEAEGCARPAEEADGDLTVATRAPCDGGAAAEFVTIAGAEHPWPGGDPRLTGPSSGAPYPDYDATVEVVTFLLSHPRA